MKNIPWAGLGVLAVVLSVPATTLAMGDGDLSATRIRRVTMVRIEAPGTAPVTRDSSDSQLGRRAAERIADAGVAPGLLGVPDQPPESLDVTIETGAAPLVEALEVQLLDAPLMAPQMSSEVRAVVRAEAACLFALDMPLSQ